MGEKLNGGTLTRKPRVHDCSAPAIRSNGINPGDEWTCGDCNAMWECKPGIDQREPDPYWERRTSPLYRPERSNSHG